RYARPFVGPHPRPVRDIGDRVVSGEILVLLEAPVEHLEEAPHLTLVPLDRVRDLLRRIAVEDIGLTHHRPDPAHLEHEPLDDQRASLRIARHQLPGLLREIDQDRARFEDDETVLVVVDDGRDAAVRIELAIPRLLLLLLVEGDRPYLVVAPELLEGDRNLVPV